MRQHFILAGRLSVLALLAACSRGNFPIATPDKCTPVNSLRINGESRAVIDAALSSKLDFRRRKYDSKDFCAFNEPTSNGEYYVLTIYDNVGNHRSETWVLLSHKQAIDTELNVYEMAADDSLKINDKIISSIGKLRGIDNPSRQELIQMLSQRAQRERKRKH